MSIGVLIIGLGQIGMEYDIDLDSKSFIYSHARAFSIHPEYNLIAAVEVDNNRCKIFEKYYNRPSYNNLEIALSKHKPELIIIAVPTSLHYETLNKTLELSTPQIILCEKPLSYSVDEANNMVYLCKEKRVALYVNYMRCSDPAVIEVKHRITSGEIKSPIKGVVWYSKGLIHNGSHFLNLLEYWLGSIVKAEVFDTGRMWNKIDPEPNFLVTFKDSSVIFLAAKEENFSHYSIELIATNGRLRYEFGGDKVVWQPICASDDISNYTVLSSDEELIPNEMNIYQWHVTDQLFKSIKKQNFYLCSGDAALKTLESIQKVL